MTTTILVGHVLTRLLDLPAKSMHCVVTSPPYYGLRDYGTEPQVWPDGWRGDLGLEPTLDLYLDHMVEVFREVRRVLRKDGTCWLNIGDSYTASSYGTGGDLKPKDLMLIPSRLAIRLQDDGWWVRSDIRLQDDGWWVRSDIAWCKRAPMPESCTDRPTSAWEHVFLLTKSARYFYDADAVRDAPSGRTNPIRNFGHVPDRNDGNSGGWALDGMKGRNMRNWWLLGPEPFPEAHFATFQPEIPRICIKAGTSERGVCPKCGAGWVRQTATSRIDTRPNLSSKYGGPAEDIRRTGEGNVAFGLARRTEATVETIGWQPICSCDTHPAAPATVLDPFLGAGTTALVADRLGRHCIGIELNHQYAEMAQKRIERDAGMFAQVTVERDVVGHTKPKSTLSVDLNLDSGYVPGRAAA